MGMRTATCRCEPWCSREGRESVVQLKRPSLKRLVLLLVTIVPVLAWAVVKPVRVVMPNLAGVSCVSQAICLDDLSRLQEAQTLYSEAVSYVGAHVGRVDGSPRVIYCATQACADAFGLGARSAVTLGTLGTVIGPRAWKPYYVRHELIHYVQARKLGVLPLLAKPSWFVEGMAYGMSEDPREKLAEPFEGYRNEFRVWHRAIGKDSLWEEAAKL